MIRELKRILKNQVYLLIILIGLAVRGVMLYNHMKYRGEIYFSLCADFWNYNGSFTEAVVILYSVIYIFSYDEENGTLPVICTTRNGRLSLFTERLLAGALAVLMSIAVLAAGNCVLSSAFGSGIEPEAWVGVFMKRSLIAAGGALGLFFVSSLICDVSRNHTFTMALCAVPYLIGYLPFLHMEKFLDPFGLWWFLRYGFFTDFMRGQTISSRPMFWAVWYTVLLIGILILALYKRKKRLEL